MSIPWVELYRPTRVADIVGNRQSATKLVNWLKQWPEVKKKAALLAGPPGVGKTTAVYAIAHESGLEVVEMNASDQRNREQILNVAGMTTTHQTLSVSSRARILLLDEVDGVFGREDMGGMGAISQVVRTSKIPVVMTANDLWNQKLSTLRNICEVIKFKRLGPPSIKKALKLIVANQQLKLPDQILDDLASTSGGDLRAAINDLEALGRYELEITADQELSGRDQTKDIFNVLPALFQAQTMQDVKTTTWGLDLDNDMFFQWIYENAHLHAGTPQELFQMYEELSHADVVRARIRTTQNWKLLPHFITHMTAGVVLSKKSRYRWTRHIFPTRLSDLSRSRKTRALRTAIYSKVGKKAHISIHNAVLEYGVLIRTLVETNPEAAAKVALWLGLTDEEIKYLVQSLIKTNSESAAKAALWLDLTDKDPKSVTKELLKRLKSEIRKFKKEYNIQVQEKSRQQMKQNPWFRPTIETQPPPESHKTLKEDAEKTEKESKEEPKEPDSKKGGYRTLDTFFGTGRK